MHELAYTFNSNILLHQTKLEFVTSHMLRDLNFAMLEIISHNMHHMTTLIQIMCKIFMRGDKLISTPPWSPLCANNKACV